MSERPRTDTDSMWTRGSFAIPPSDSAGPGAEWKAGYHYFAHFTRRDGRPVPDCVVIMGPEMNAAALRALSLRSDLAMAGDWPDEAWREEREIDHGFAEFQVAAEREWAGGAAADSADGGDSPRPRLTRPDGTDPEGFARRVAQAYREALRQTGAPAKALAAEAGVPVTTVHRWIRDARRLGALGPAPKKGHAG